MPAIIKPRPLAPAADAEPCASAALVAAVLANVEECAGHFHSQLSDREFRELVRARGRSCDAALLELRRAALARGEGSRPVDAASGLPRRRITGRSVGDRGPASRPLSADAVRLRELEQEVVRLRRLLADREPRD